MNVNEHKFLADFQPIGSQATLTSALVSTVLNYGAVFAVFFIIGRALKLGLGL